MSTDTTTHPKEYRKLNIRLIKRLAHYIAQGSYATTACMICNVSEDSLIDWKHQADADSKAGLEDSLPIRLVVALKEAEAYRERVMVDRLVAGAMPGERKRVTKINPDGTKSEEITETGGDWIAAATFLERRHPERWGRRDRLQVEENKRVEVNVIVKHYSEEIPAPPQATQVTEGEYKELGTGEEGGQDAGH